jgi:hypothetical protein
MRPCPVCLSPSRTLVFSMSYLVPDGWSVPSRIDWQTCDDCGMLYGDGDFAQADLDKYYIEHYGYGVNSPANIERLKGDAAMIAETVPNKNACIIDFGGAGDDGKSIVEQELTKRFGHWNADCIGPADPLPHGCDVIYASHVIEHIYDLPETMTRITDALAADGLLIIDVPDATGLLRQWKMPILDFNTKHLNHFTLRNLLDLGKQYGFELVHLKPYDLENAPAWQAHFRRLDVADTSYIHIYEKIDARLMKMIRLGGQPVNIWGLGDITWHVLSRYATDPASKDEPLTILDYIDNDPAYRGQTFNGKPVQERPTNDAPIVILAQGQRQRLIANIRKMNITNEIIEI